MDLRNYFGVTSLGKYRYLVPWSDLYDSEISKIVVLSIFISPMMKYRAALQKKLLGACQIILVKVPLIGFLSSQLFCFQYLEALTLVCQMA